MSFTRIHKIKTRFKINAQNESNLKFDKEYFIP